MAYATRDKSNSFRLADHFYFLFQPVLLGIVLFYLSDLLKPCVGLTR